MKKMFCLFWILFFVSGSFSEVFSQKATYSEVWMTFKTYPYSDPNPMPSIAIKGDISRFYPYSLFEGYTDEGRDEKWKMVILENPFIKVLVAPGLGGKVYGAIEKSTGKEFIYYNKVVKFRDVGIRGPWTSGGIEHNYGLDLGHAPWAANDVDYLVRENKDGSMSCFVGGPELAARTQWRVEIRLPKDKAYFETKGLWHNPNPQEDSYLSWENGAFAVSDSMEFAFPGTHYIYHNGESYPWPIENGHKISWYNQNNFGSHKAHHVAGTYTHWFGGYWHEKDFGFGRSGEYTEAPGKKIWLWALSREGGIWENFLTDTDGQYMEAQSGVKLNQPGENTGNHSPYGQIGFKPFYTDVKTEYWFPVKNTGGMVDANRYGSLNVIRSGNEIEIRISPNQKITDTLFLFQNGHKTIAQPVRLQTMIDFSTRMTIENVVDYEVKLGRNMLSFSSDPNKLAVDRPVATPYSPTENTAEHLYKTGIDEYRMRDYVPALKHLKAVLQKEPTHSRALVTIAEIYYRRGEYDEGLKYALKPLEYDTYDPAANFVYATLLDAKGENVKAEEAYSIAAFAMEFRSASYTKIAEINMRSRDYERSALYAEKALDFNRYNLQANEILTSAYRKMNDTTKADRAVKDLLEIDPLNNYGRFEQYLLNPDEQSLNNFNELIRSELPFEEYLELAVRYSNQGLNDEAIRVLEQSPEYPVVNYWLAYLYKEKNSTKSRENLKQAVNSAPDFVFPYRKESRVILEWAQQENPSWKTNYYLSMIFWNMHQLKKAMDLMNGIKENVDFAPFYLTRGTLAEDLGDIQQASLDFKKALELNDDDWRGRFYLSNLLRQQGDLVGWLENSVIGYKKYPDNQIMSLNYVAALVDNGQPAQALKYLKNILSLPQEHGKAGHQLFELSNLQLALESIQNKKYKKALDYLDESRKWPEHLGSGKPFDPDERLQNLMASYAESKLKNNQKADAYLKEISDYTLRHGTRDISLYGIEEPMSFYIGVNTMRKLGKRDAADQLMKYWHFEQDSLSTWKLGPGLNSPEVRWVLSSYEGKNDQYRQLGEKILAGKTKNKFQIFLRFIDIKNQQ